METTKEIDDKIAELEEGLKLQLAFFFHLCQQVPLNGMGLCVKSYSIRRHNDIVQGIRQEIDSLRQQKKDAETKMLKEESSEPEQADNEQRDTAEKTEGK